ncbi:MAG: hypothetical protein GDA51_13005 [Ekhidna sp.]|nr:hypothetical protein [Ekhidna sp.]MBC6408959.1 hypothetical protein [Ekhidna sp.]MBC6427352.1 hypothetical protein [Ekhidna sp.]
MEITVDNPINKVDSKALDNAYKVILEALNEIVKKNDHPDDEVEYVTDLIKEAYLRRKSNLFIKNYTDDFSHYLKHALHFALNQESTESQIRDYAKLSYYKRKKHLVASDR